MCVGKFGARAAVAGDDHGQVRCEQQGLVADIAGACSLGSTKPASAEPPAIAPRQDHGMCGPAPAARRRSRARSGVLPVPPAVRLPTQITRACGRKGMACRRFQSRHGAIGPAQRRKRADREARADIVAVPEFRCAHGPAEALRRLVRVFSRRHPTAHERRGPPAAPRSRAPVRDCADRRPARATSSSTDATGRQPLRGEDRGIGVAKIVRIRTGDDGNAEPRRLQRILPAFARPGSCPRRRRAPGDRTSPSSPIVSAM